MSAEQNNTPRPLSVDELDTVGELVCASGVTLLGSGLAADPRIAAALATAAVIEAAVGIGAYVIARTEVSNEDQ